MGAQTRELDAVIYPLMPKGVEHRALSVRPLAIGLVIYPLMPKGVEHVLPIE